MRLDKFLGESGALSRREAGKAVRRGRIFVNGIPALRADMHIDEKKDNVTLDGTPVLYTPFVYLWLNKPAGYVSATEDRHLPVVTELLPKELQKRGIFPCGRLDRDTVGWMLLTDDGALAHRLLSPRRHVEKRYRFTAQFPIDPSAEGKLASGITLADGTICRPACLVADADRMGGEITLTEGRYHEIKRMLEALDNRVTFLERISFGGIDADLSLARGSFRHCTEEELAHLRACAGVSENKDVEENEE